MRKNIQKCFLCLLMLALLPGALPLSAMASPVSPYWARAKGTTLYQTSDEGILRSLPSVECFQITGEDSNWLYVTTSASGGFHQNARIRRQAVTPVRDLSQCLAVVNNPVSSDRLHLRTRPTSGSVSRGKYYNGTLVFVYEVNNGWAKVRLADLEGYMEAKYLLFGEAGLVFTQTPPIVTVSNRGGTGLRLRNGPGTGYSNIGFRKNGATVIVLGLTRDWAHVQLIENGHTGYMLLSGLSPLLQYDYDTASVPPKPTAKPSAPVADTWQGPFGYHRAAPWTLQINDYTGVVKNPNPADRLHLRTAPRTNAQSLGKYYNGVRVVILGVSDGEWTKVGIGNLEGYMKTEFLVIGEVPGQLKPASAMPIMVVSNPNPAKNLHLREKPTTSSRSLGLYPNGAEVILMGFSREWAHVIVNGRMGFMLGKYLR